MQTKSLFSIAFDIVIPIVILRTLSDKLPTAAVITLALLVPLCWGMYQLLEQKKTDMLAAISIIAILATGILSIVTQNPFWIAIKEAAVPLIIGVVLLIGLLRNKPLVWAVAKNIVNSKAIEKAYKKKKKIKTLERTKKNIEIVVICSFFVSAMMNYILTLIIVNAPTQTPEFTKQLAQLQTVSIFVIGIPLMVVMMVMLFVVLYKVTKDTGMTLEEIVEK